MAYFKALDDDPSYMPSLAKIITKLKRKSLKREKILVHGFSEEEFEKIKKKANNLGAMIIWKPRLKRKEELSSVTKIFTKSFSTLPDDIKVEANLKDIKILLKPVSWLRACEAGFKRVDATEYKD